MHSSIRASEKLPVSDGRTGGAVGDALEESRRGIGSLRGGAAKRGLFGCSPGMPGKDGCLRWRLALASRQRRRTDKNRCDRNRPVRGEVPIAVVGAHFGPTARERENPPHQAENRRSVEGCGPTAVSQRRLVQKSDHDDDAIAEIGQSARPWQTS